MKQSQPRRKEKDWCDYYLAEKVKNELERTNSTFWILCLLSSCHHNIQVNYLVSKSEVPTQLVKSLTGYDEEDMQVVLNQAVEWQLQDIVSEKCHGLRVKLVD